MAKSRLERRAAQLEMDGADPLRLEVLETARRFKRSWVDMAAALLRVRESRAYETWGYADLYAYCSEELSLKPRTVDKLTGSYSALEQHAPELLRRDAGRSVPSCDSIDYFAQIVGEHSDDPPRPRGSIDELRQAVFDEGLGVAQLRKQFNPIFHPRSDEDIERETVERASAAARRLASLLPSVRFLKRARVAELVATLEELQRELAGAEQRPRKAS